VLIVSVGTCPWTCILLETLVEIRKTSRKLIRISTHLSQVL